jgi:glycosyltransferase involved in cell wall biosynthesis
MESFAVHIVLISDSAPPIHCGIGDHTVLLADALRRSGCDITILARQGKEGDGVGILGGENGLLPLKLLQEKLSKLEPDLLVLQFTPLMYGVSSRTDRVRMVDAWLRLGQTWKTAIIVHETYFRTWWYPLSWIRGTQERYYLRRMVEASGHVFTASEPLAKEMNAWRRGKPVCWLPISSNFPAVAANREALRSQRGLDAQDVVLVLFSGGSSLKWLSKHVEYTDVRLRAAGVSAKWLLLGGIPADWFRLKAPVISPGRLAPSEISEWLTASDLFLMPHYAGVSAKRGTLMAAMQHRLPVVGTRTVMTDEFWRELEGVCLTPLLSTKRFARQVLDLGEDSEMRRSLGLSNHDYFQRNFTWEKLAEVLLREVST